jgi:TIGR03009 family protein
VQNLAVLELNPDGKKDLAEKLICTGTYLYQFVPAQKEIRAYEMPKPKPGQVADEGFLGLLFGMKSEEAKKRYTLTLAKEDQWYVYVDIAPRDPKDKADFAKARLVLNKDSYLPRQLWFEHANGNEVTWDIPQLKTGVTLDRRLFDAPKAPEGWKLVPVNRDLKPTQPRVIRQNNK